MLYVALTELVFLGYSKSSVPWRLNIQVVVEIFLTSFQI